MNAGRRLRSCHGVGAGRHQYHPEGRCAGWGGYITAGRDYSVGGDTLAGTLHLAANLGESGFLNVTGFHRFHDFTRVGGLDRRVTDIKGTLLTATSSPSLNATQRQLYPLMAGFAYVNWINGDAQSSLTNLQYNTAYNFGDVEVYSFGTYSKRIASAYQNARVPTRVARTVAGGTTYFDPDGDNPPNGFSPRQKIREDDMAFTGGDAGGFRYDLSTEFTVNADLRREIEAGLAAPITLAFGAEYRRNVYEIGSGDAGSIYKSPAVN
ncbi:hypothetical protein [Sphingomonas parapaucimobilis]|uniref:hypothetical protein n=1 Tax=Sphingomonas parapaucimobilis TaxID=28213 RepID=UPI0035C7A195